MEIKYKNIVKFLKGLIIILGITLVIFGGPVYSQQNSSDSTNVHIKKIGYDKFQHAAVSCLLTLGGQYVLESKSDINRNNAICYSASSSALIGLTKELSDMKTRSRPFDWGDMIANLVGISLAVTIIII